MFLYFISVFNLSFYVNNTLSEVGKTYVNEVICLKSKGTSRGTLRNKCWEILLCIIIMIIKILPITLSFPYCNFSISTFFHLVASNLYSLFKSFVSFASFYFFIYIYINEYIVWYFVSIVIILFYIFISNQYKSPNFTNMFYFSIFPLCFSLPSFHFLLSNMYYHQNARKTQDE